jgi:uncharacterized protein YfaS (alpha-2-macroglobulin family)
VTYPNVLVLDYLRATGLAAPDAKSRAEQLVATGYQRHLTFEASGGGFSLFCGGKPEVFYSAYALMLLGDMARVYPVDTELVQRTAGWLLRHQRPDGTWQAQDARTGGGVLGATAYVVWALAEAGFADAPEVRAGLEAVRRLAASESDAYRLALAANALAVAAPGDRSTREVLGRLHELRRDEAAVSWWDGSDRSFMGATGQSLAIETTALAASALLRGEVHAATVNRALGWILQNKDPKGTWRTTQATILSLRALLLAARRAGQGRVASTVRVRLGESAAHEISLVPGTADLVHVVRFADGLTPGQGRDLRIDAPEGSNLVYQVTSEYHMPWSHVPLEQEGPLELGVLYERREMRLGESAAVKLTLRSRATHSIRMPLVELGVPPGFTVQSGDLERLVEQGRIARYELAGRSLIVYLEHLEPNVPIELELHLRAGVPGRVKTPVSVAYDYYNPTLRSLSRPIELLVEE